MHPAIQKLLDSWTPTTITFANGRQRTITAKRLQVFAAKLEVADNGCWHWTGYLAPTKYGMTKIQGIGVNTHRFSYLAFVGTIPDGMHLDHACHTEAIKRQECAGGEECLHRRCANPSHLKPVTPRDNVLTSLSWAAEHAKRATCVNGHELEGDALYVRPSGGRACYQCHRELDRRQRRERAEQEGRAVLPLPGDRTHCPHGHPYDEANTRYCRGQRVCRTCTARSSREYQARKKAERDRKDGA
jgi:hypothetical protein